MSPPTTGDFVIDNTLKEMVKIYEEVLNDNFN